MPDENINEIFTQVSVDLSQVSQNIAKLNVSLKDLGVELKLVGQQAQFPRKSLQDFGEGLMKTLMIGLRWYATYRIIRTTLGAIGKAFEDIKRLQVQEIFTPLIFSGKEMSEVLSQASKLALKWGYDVYQSYEAIIRFGRVLKDFNTSVYLTDVALETMRASGQGLNEITTSMIGLITNLGVSTEEVAKAMDILYSAALKTDEPMDLLGERFQGGTNALQSFTDAMDQGALGLQNLGFSFSQIAAIFNILITRSDRTGQSIGSLFAKLAGGLKDNQRLLDIYKQVGIQLEYSEKLLPLLAEGWSKMDINQRNAVISAAGVTGAGRDLVEVFFKALPDAMNKYNEILSNTNLRHEMASKMMETVAGKEARLKTATQLLGISFKDELLPPLTILIDLLTYLIRKTTLAAETLSTLFIKTPLAGIKQFYELLRPPETGEGPIETLRNRFRAMLGIGQDWQKDWQDLWKKYLSEAEWDAMLEQGIMPEKLQNKMQDVFARAMGTTPEQTQIMEDASRIIRKYRSQIDIATLSLGAFATTQEVNQVKTQLLKKEIEELTELMPKLVDETSKLEVSEELARANKEVEELEIHYGNLIALSDRLARSTQQGPPTIKEMIDKTRSLSSEFEDIATRRIIDIIKGTGTWRDLLDNIADVVLEEIIRKLVRISLGSEAEGGGVFGGIAGILSALFSLFGGGTAAAPASTGPQTVIVHQGGEIPLPRFQFGGEVPVLARPGEYVVREGPAQKYKGLLEAINKGEEIGAGQNVTYVIQAVDAPSFFELVRRNPSAIHSVIQEAKRFNKPGFRRGD